MSVIDHAQIIKLMRSFNAGTLAWSECNHVEHLTVALWFCREYSAEIAMEKLREGILKYYEQVKDDDGCGLGSYYHETATRFWIGQVQRFLINQPPERTLTELLVDLLQCCSDSKLILQHYSRERLRSRQAFQQWVEPDLLPLSPIAANPDAL